MNVEKHRYSKETVIDFSKTKFTSLGDYYFDIYDKETDKTLYQIIITFRNVTDENNFPLPQTYSLIQIKSILRDGEKVENVNINIKNPNTFLAIKHTKENNSILENVYIDLIIDSYERETYSIIDGNLYDEKVDNSKLRIGNHIVFKSNDSFVNQTYKLTNGGKVLIGLSGLDDVYQIPVGTKYRAVATDNKKYREKYDISGIDNVRVAGVTPDSNEIIITNSTQSNPYTGIFYKVGPFVIVIIVAIVGIILLKKMSLKDEKDKKNNK